MPIPTICLPRNLFRYPRFTTRAFSLFVSFPPILLLLSLSLFLSPFVVCDRSRDRFEYPSGSRLLFQTSLSTTIASSRRVNTIRVSAWKETTSQEVATYPWRMWNKRGWVSASPIPGVKILKQKWPILGLNFFTGVDLIRSCVFPEDRGCAENGIWSDTYIIVNLYQVYVYRIVQEYFN